MIDEHAEELLAPRVVRSSLDPQKLVDEGLFAFLLQHEIHKATRLRYCLSILCLAPDPFPGEITPVLNHLATEAIRHIRATDTVSTFSSSCFALLLVDAEVRNLAAILDRLRGALEPISITKAKGRDFTLSAGGGCYPQTAVSGNELMQQAHDLMARAKGEGGNRLYIPS